MKRTLLLLSLPILFFSSCRQAPKPFSTIENQYTFQIDGGTYTLAAINDDIIKVSYQDSITYSNRTYAPILTDAMPMQADITDSVVNFNTAEVRVEVQLQPFRIQFFDLETGLKLSEEQGYTRQADTTSFRFFLQPQEAIYGTGARALPMDRRGYAFKCYNQPNYGYGMGADFLNYSIPHLYSSNQYMLLIDNPAKAYFDIGKTEEDVLDFSSLGGNMAYYFINGNNFEELISEYTLLTGRQPLPPLWALGHLQSRFGYKNPISGGLYSQSGFGSRLSGRCHYSGYFLVWGRNRRRENGAVGLGCRKLAGPGRDDRQLEGKRRQNHYHFRAFFHEEV
jgi:oligosaccharide 4-alpha-D-glucosyltransferase